MDLDDAKEAMLAQLDFAFEESHQTLQDRFRHRRARSMVERFTWPVSASSTAIISALRALRELQALLRHDIPAPEGSEMEVMDFETEDEDGMPVNIRISPSPDDESCSCESCSCGCD
jgi:hypothetical protein